MARLVIVVDMDVDPTLEDPHDMADYAIDGDCDDPVITVVAAEWGGDSDIGRVVRAMFPA